MGEVVKLPPAREADNEIVIYACVECEAHAAWILYRDGTIQCSLCGETIDGLQTISDDSIIFTPDFEVNVDDE